MSRILWHITKISHSTSWHDPCNAPTHPTCLTLEQAASFAGQLRWRSMCSVRCCLENLGRPRGSPGDDGLVGGVIQNGTRSLVMLRITKRGSCVARVGRPHLCGRIHNYYVTTPPVVGFSKNRATAAGGASHRSAWREARAAVVLFCVPSLVLRLPFRAAAVVLSSLLLLFFFSYVFKLGHRCPKKKIRKKREEEQQEKRQGKQREKESRSEKRSGAAAVDKKYIEGVTQFGARQLKI